MGQRNSLGGLVVFSIGLWSCFHFLGHSAHVSPKPKAEVVAYAMKQLGKPYLYGGTGPDAFDCSGLTQNAYAAAGIPIPRTSEDQWKAGPRTSHPRRGDLVFFTGASVDPPPGHVGIYLGPHKMIDAYANGVPVRVESFGLPSSAGGLQDPTGYTDP